ncbi:MAG: hypothetical protein HUU11_11415 [Anaerolineales bacterium]|nr:hypothetical protein [Anaerolineales bacterium]
MIQTAIFVLNLYFILILLTSGLSKMASPDYSLLNAIKLRNLFIPFGQTLYQFLAWIEIGVSILLATNTSIRLATIANTALFATFLVSQIIVLSIAKGTNCGCFGNIYKIQNDKIHILVTAAQALLSYIYYWLTTVYSEVPNIQVLVSLIVFLGLCVWILARRLSRLAIQAKNTSKLNQP